MKHLKNLKAKASNKLQERGKFALSIPVLCDVLLKETNCNLGCGTEHFHDDITRLK